MMAVLVTSKVQAFAESVRLAAMYLGSVIGLVSAAYLYEDIVNASIGLFIGNIVVWLLMAFKANTLSNPANVI